MAWNLDRVEHGTFARNPLVAVVAQVRFHPILQVRKRVPDFQDAIRDRFPGFEDRPVQELSVRGLPGLAPVTLRQDSVFQFLRGDGSATLTLGQEALALEDRRHEKREAFLGDVQAALDALAGTVGRVAPLRVGLRYVNVIDRAAISESLGRDATWEELVAPDLLRPAGSRADIDGTTFYVETSSPLDEGAMTVRHGLLVGPGSSVPRFRLDIDRYLAEPFDFGRAVELLRGFSDDIFHVFVSAAGPALVEWLNG